VVAAAIVHKNQLKGLAGALHDHPQTVIELGHVLFFVMKGDND
jgi:hypothetical protein